MDEDEEDEFGEEDPEDDLPPMDDLPPAVDHFKVFYMEFCAFWTENM
jgi:hypothetical protein